MKILFSVFFFALTLSVTAQVSEYESVAKTVNYYLEGGTNNDLEMLMKAFHKDGEVTFVNDKGELQSKKATDFFGGMKPGPKKDRTCRIANINISGTAANAHLIIEGADYRFNDYMTLLKFGDEWKIVTKIYYGEKI